MKFDAWGNRLLMVSYGGDGDDIASSVTTAPGGGFAIFGKTTSFDPTALDYLLMRLDSQGQCPGCF